MRVTHADGEYRVQATFAENPTVKAAGCWWNREARCWMTRDWRAAEKLASYCDPTAQAAVQAARSAAQAAVEASRSTDAAVAVPAPEGLDYLPFQRAGIAYAASRPTTLIADEMGLGKTIQALGVINADPSIRQVLIVCPASLRLNWLREAKRWLVRPFTVCVVDGPSIPNGLQAVVCIINYDILKKYRQALRETTWDLLVADECHYAKNPKAQRTIELLGGQIKHKATRTEPAREETVPAIPARRRLYLTGTPIVNRPIELWPLLRSTGDPLWRSWHAYVTRYCAAYQDAWGWKVDGASHLDELQDKLRATLMVRRLKKDVLTELPAKRRQIIELPANGAAGAVQAEAQAWDAHQAKILALQTAVELAKAADDPTEYGDAVAALREGLRVAFTEMSKVRHATALAKVPYVIEHLLEAVDSAGKVVLFAHHIDVIAAIEQGCAAAGVRSVVLTGAQSMPERQAAVDAFQTDPEVKVFIGGFMAAGVGLTLTAASHVIFAELDWVPGNISQAEDRCHRIGQVNSVLVQHLVLEKSLDAEMARRLVEKQAVIDSALDRQHATAAGDAAWGSLISIGEAATRTVTRAQVEAEAPAIPAEEVAEIHRKLRILSGMCDGALALDGAGFNKFDSPIGKSLAAAERLTPKMAALGRRLVTKYRRQLGG